MKCPYRIVVITKKGEVVDTRAFVAQPIVPRAGETVHAGMREYTVISVEHSFANDRWFPEGCQEICLICEEKDS